MTFSSPNWRSLNHFKRSQRIARDVYIHICIIYLYIHLYCMSISVSLFIINTYIHIMSIFCSVSVCHGRSWSISVLVGGFNPSEKYDRQIGNLPQIGMKVKNLWVATTQYIIYRYRYHTDINCWPLTPVVESPKHLRGFFSSKAHPESVWPGILRLKNLSIGSSIFKQMWMFPKIVVRPNHPF